MRTGRSSRSTTACLVSGTVYRLLVVSANTAISASTAQKIGLRVRDMDAAPIAGWR